MNGKWEITDVRDVFEDPFIKLEIANVDLPDGNKIEHAMISTPGNRGFAATVAFRPQHGVLMIWRHRFITDTWSWELPAGGIDEKEKPAEAAERELLEETGWAPAKLEPLITFQPLPGLANREAHVFFTAGATWKAELTDTNEINDVAWLPFDKIRQLIDKGDVSDGCTLTALGLAQMKGLVG